jgi:hypothetical protein
LKGKPGRYGTEKRLVTQSPWKKEKKRVEKRKEEGRRRGEEEREEGRERKSPIIHWCSMRELCWYVKEGHRRGN